MSTGHTPQILVTLSPQGTLQVELPASNGTRRIVPITAAKAGGILLRMLHARLTGQVEIGFDGAPTRQQVEHWEKHHTFPRESCRFCISAGKTKGPSRKSVQRTLIAKHGDIEITCLKPAKYRGAKVDLTLEDLGL